MENSLRAANAVTVNDDAAEKAARRKSRGGRKSFGGAGLSPHQVASPRRKLELKAQCKEAVKLATQGKVNRKNAWSMPLSQMARAQLDDDEDAGGVNFQHASLTIDALSTIYGYRIDETHATTQKFQENLTRTGHGGGGSKDNNADDDGADSDADGEGGVGGGGAKKLKVKKASATLAKNPRSLCFKAPELEFDIDPLFHQMSSKFDQGGGAGMLLNNLGVAQGCTIVFDGSVATKDAAPCDAPPQHNVDVDALCASVGLSLGDIATLELCPALDEFYAQRDDMRGLASASSPAPASPAHSAPEVDASESDDGYASDGGGDWGGGDDWGENDDDAQAAVTPAAVSPLGKDAAPANSVLGAMQLVGLSGSSEFDFFDQSKLDKIWAGQKYAVWKRPNKPKRRPSDSAEDGAAEGAAEGGKRQRKKAFLIDFGTALAPDTFKPAKNQAATQLSTAVLKKYEREASDLRLPVDLHYKPRQLVQLFFNRELRFRQRASTSTSANDGVSASVHEAGGASNQGACLGYMSNDDNDYEGFESGGDDDFDFDGNNTAQQTPVEEPERVEKIAISYETKLKKVNVKKLKLSLWSQLGGGEETPAEERAADEEVEEIKSQSFTSAIESVSKEVRWRACCCCYCFCCCCCCCCSVACASLHCVALPCLCVYQVPSNVTVPFYFISLLHLANEHGLELSDKADLSDLIVARH